MVSNSILAGLGRDVMVVGHERGGWYWSWSGTALSCHRDFRLLRQHWGGGDRIR
jgi:hypothetical protein